MEPWTFVFNLDLRLRQTLFAWKSRPRRHVVASGGWRTTSNRSCGSRTNRASFDRTSAGIMPSIVERCLVAPRCVSAEEGRSFPYKSDGRRSKERRAPYSFGDFLAEMMDPKVPSTMLSWFCCCFRRRGGEGWTSPLETICRNALPRLAAEACCRH